MKKVYLLGLAASALLAGMYVQGCSGGDSADGGGGGSVKTCNTDSDCGSDICNTVGHVCMQKCSAGADCPDSAKTCAQITGATSAAVCQCSTDALCGGGSNYCNNNDKLCEVKCTDNTGCQEFNPARTCVNSQCVAGGTTDGGADGGNTTCDATHPCASGSYCGTNGQCVQGASNCDATAAEPSTCSYGQACFSDPSVSSLPVCEEPFGQGGQCPAVSAPPTVTPNASPVIYDVRRTGNTRQDTTCVDSNGNALDIVEFAVSYYDPQNDVPTSNTYGNVKYVKPSGSQQATYERTSNAGSTFTFEICSPTASIHAGVVLIDAAGNISNTGCLP